MRYEARRGTGTGTGSWDMGVGGVVLFMWIHGFDTLYSDINALRKKDRETRAAEVVKFRTLNFLS